MTALIIVGSIVLLVAVLLALPVCVHAQYSDAFTVKARYLGIPVFSYPAKDKKPGRVKKGKAKEREETPEQPKKKETLSELLDKISMVRDLMGSASKAVKIILRRSKIKDLSLDVTVARGDAAQTAMLYGKLCAAVGGLLAAARNFFTIDSSRIQIRPDFNREEPEVSGSLCWQVRPGTVLWGAIVAAVDFLRKFLHNKMEAQAPMEKGGTKV